MRAWPALDVAPPDDLVQAALADFDIAAIDENAPGRWRVFFRTPEDRARATEALRRRFPALAMTAVEVPDEDWAARSQASLTAVRVGNIVVAPPWDLDRLTPAPVTIVIHPSMGFGTGHHATTRLCLAHLQALELSGCAAVDVGTGSGVLAIAASRLGAATVLAIDDDPDAIASARENLALNPGANVTLGVVDLRRAAALRPVDLVLANLTGALLAAAAAPLQALAAPGAHLVLSGFLTHEEPSVLEAFAPCAMRARSQEDEWVCVTLQRPRARTPATA